VIFQDPEPINLRSGPRSWPRSTDYETHLRAASKNACMQIVQLLLDKGADIQISGSNGLVLKAASVCGNEHIVSDVA
jgi:hypothetical protein